MNTRDFEVRSATLQHFASQTMLNVVVNGYIGFEVLAAVTMNRTIVLDVTPLSLI